MKAKINARFAYVIDRTMISDHELKCLCDVRHGQLVLMSPQAVRAIREAVRIDTGKQRRRWVTVQATAG